MEHFVDFEPVGRRGPCPEDETLWDAARRLGVDLVAVCGGRGSCGRCRVQVIAGELSPITSQERHFFPPAQLQAGYRLACQTYPRSDCRIRVPPESLSTPQRTQVEGEEVAVTPDPAVVALNVVLPPATLDDLRSDSTRIADALAQQHGVTVSRTDIDALRAAPLTVREYNWRANVAVRGGECIAVRRPDARTLGLAVDLGTTKIAGYLIDLPTGATLHAQGATNPQISYGEDLISRCNYAMQAPEQAAQMQELAASAIARLAADLVASAGVRLEEIVDVVIVGNTAMHHLLLRLPVGQLALSPFVAAVSESMDVKARDALLPFASGAYVHLLPNVAGYVGGDHIAMILGTRLHEAEGNVLALDIGTNTEICLASHGTLRSVSCASGPAFEGAHILCGMRAAAGAIEHVQIREHEIDYNTIGNVPPVGICGSGILDALAALYRHGVVNVRGRMQDHERVRVGAGEQREFVLAEAASSGSGQAIVVTQQDVRELQLAKGAIRTGIEALLLDAHLHDEQLDQVIIAGAFGSYIDVTSAIAIGMLPALPLDRFRQVGNAAGTGARLALISQAQRRLAQDVGRRIQYIELAAVPGFQDLFARSMILGEYRI